MGMNKRFTSLMVVVFSGLLFVTVGALTAADVPDEIVISSECYKKDIKGPVKFTHKKHAEDYNIGCSECHHVYKDGKNVWKEGDPVQKCSACHDPEKRDGDVDKLKNAYHKNCKNCHKTLGKEGKPTGPYKKCNDCHEKD